MRTVSSNERAAGFLNGLRSLASGARPVDLARGACVQRTLHDLAARLVLREVVRLTLARRASEPSMLAAAVEIPPGPPGSTLWFPGTARPRSRGPSAETFHETTPFADFRPPEGHGRSALLRPLSAGELCRQFVYSRSRAYKSFLSYNKRSLETKAF